MRKTVSIAYLLARATDSIADTSSASPRSRLEVLKTMNEMIQSLGSGYKESDFVQLPQEIIEAQSHAGEKLLLSQFEQCLLVAEGLPADERELIKKVLKVIIEGQLWDLTYFDKRDCVESSDETDWYTYHVAGCVGEFWTDVAVLGLGESFTVADVPTMKEMGIHFGKGLQLVNILRDREEDKERGRSYLPPDGDIHSWEVLCRSYLKDGVRYAQALKSRRLRFSTVLPAWLGLATLDLIEEGATRGGKVVKQKVSRSVVRRLMVKALLFSWKRPEFL